MHDLHDGTMRDVTRCPNQSPQKSVLKGGDWENVVGDREQEAGGGAI